jgi:hypothetical protein
MPRTFPRAAQVWLSFACVAITTFAQPALPHFKADGGIAASDLSGWTPFGPAEWTAHDGILTGSPKSGGGWLLFDKPMANVGAYAQI